MLNDLSARSYIIQSLYQWCLDKGYTPHLLVQWDGREDNKVLEQYTVNNQVILNISPVSVKDLVINDKGVNFSARFSGKIVNIYLHYEEIITIFSKETEQYIAFPKIVTPVLVPDSVNKNKKADKPKRQTPPLSIV